MKFFVLFILIIISLLFCEKNTWEDQLSSKNLVNYKIYSNDQNNSYLPYDSKYSFELKWQKPNLFSGDQLIPLHIALKDSLILIWYGSRIDLRSKVDGESLWKNEILPIAEFDLKEEGLITIDNFGYYKIINLENRDSEKFSLPFLSIQSRLLFSERNGEAISYCYQAIPTPTNSPGDNFSGPEFIFSKFLPDKRKFIWQFVRNEIVKAVLRTTDKKTTLIVTEDNIYNFDSEATSDKHVKNIKFSKIIGASLNHSEDLLLYIENEEKKVELKNVTLEGNIIWSYTLENVPSFQPPASHPEGNIYIVSGNNLECIRDGKRTWSFQLPSTPGKALITIIKDASVLVSSELFLLHISIEGDLLSKNLFDFPITCRPVIDSDGNIFFATQQYIYCMK